MNFPLMDRFAICYRLMVLYRAPRSNRGPMCFGMLKPKRLMSHSTAKTTAGERRSSVWWRKGRACVCESVEMFETVAS